MKVKQEHRQFVVDNVEKMRANAMQSALETQGLTICQANNVVRNQRVKLGVYRNASLDSTHANFKGGNKPGAWKFKGGQPIKVEKGDKFRDRVKEF